jgi:electron transfer flavoprotein alpha subunit/NAD-dependent dihydropyrimidine dehydrogenase PreA subunit
MSVVVHEKKCKGCKLCIAACPYDQIVLQDKKAVLKDGCTQCGACIDSCKYGAIGFEGAQERVRMDITPFKGIYVFIEQDHNNPAKVSLELLGKARELADAYLKLGRKQLVTAIVISDEAGSLADQVIHHGADHVIMAEDPSFRVYQTEIYTKAVVQVAREKKPEILLFGATAQGRDLAPRVANRLRTGLTADCTSLDISAEEGILLQTRPAFGGNIMATIVCPDNRPQMATVRPGVMKKYTVDPRRTGTREKIRVELEQKDFVSRVLEIIAITQRHVNLEEARIIVAGGHGVKNAEGFKILEALAAELGAELGATRAAVDAGWITVDHQIGQTGKTVRPELYIACGISGAIQHLAGMAQSKHIIAVNTDRKAPIVSAADVTFVGDLFQIVPLLTERIRDYKEKNGLTVKER